MPREAKEFDAEELLAKPTSALQTHLTEWIKEKAGLTFTTKKEESAFDLGVKATVALRTYHQASEENQERLADLAAARESAEAPAPAKAAPKAPKKAPTPVAAEEPEPEAKPAKVKKSAKKAAPAAETVPAKTKKVKVSAGEAPF